MNIIEVICCSILVGFPLVGFLKGFVKTATPIVSSLLTFLVLFILKDWGFAFLFKWVFFQSGNILPRIVVVILVFILGSLMFRAIIKALNILTKIPLVKGANKILGIIFGAIEGLIIVWFILYFVSVFKTTGFGITGLEAVSKNEILLYLYKYNLVEQYMVMFTSL